MSQYYNTPSTPAPASLPSTPTTPARTSTSTQTTRSTSTQQRRGTETTETASQAQLNLRNKDPQNLGNLGSVRVSEITNPTEDSLKSQQNSRDFIDSARQVVSDEARQYFTYLESRGIEFGIFAEEISYFRNFTDSKGNRGSYPAFETARKHFVTMITPGRTLHGSPTPLTNSDIKLAHPELTDSKINTMRNAFSTNSTKRAFSYPIEVRKGSLTTDEITKLRAYGSEFYSYVNSKSPLIVRQRQQYQAPFYRKQSPKTGNSPQTFTSPNQPAIANPGDFWFDTNSSTLFIFTQIDNQVYWVET